MNYQIGRIPPTKPSVEEIKYRLLQSYRAMKEWVDFLESHQLMTPKGHHAAESLKIECASIKKLLVQFEVMEKEGSHE